MAQAGTEAIADGMRFNITGMDCASCARKIDTAVRRINGVEDVNVSVMNAAMTVRHDNRNGLVPAITKQVEALGYGATLATGSALVPAAPAHDHDHDHAHAHAHAENEDEDEDEDDHASEKSSSASHGHLHSHNSGEGPWWQQPRMQLTIASGAALVVAYIGGRIFPALDLWLFGLAMLVGLVPIMRRAWAAARVGMPFSIEMLMTIAAIGAVIIGATEEAAMVVFLFLVGELLEGVAAGRARESIRGLSALVPSTAFVERENGATEEVPASTLTLGATIMVRPGDRIAADGEIVAGDSAINEAPVTGESTPVRKGPGETVFAGTVNGEAVLRIRVTAAANDNTIARIIRLVEEAQESKAPSERFIDRFSTWYTPFVALLALLVAVLPPLIGGANWDEWIYKGLAILLIGCPCALVISTPAAIAASLSAGARRGLLMKGGTVLEEVGRLQTIAFDKTGTLTEGKPRVTDILPFVGNETEVLRLAAGLEGGSSHPLALAILEAAESRGLFLPSVTDAVALGGKGVTGTIEGATILLGSPQAVHESEPLTDAQAEAIIRLNDAGKTVSVLMSRRDGRQQILGAIAMRDEPRADAAAGLAQLSRLGIKAVMLTGDNARTAQAVAKDLGITAHAELLPQDKQRIVGTLQTSGQKVGKVGDGINDAPALAAANVGIAMGGGTDVALETADAAILHGRVSDIAAMVMLSRATMSNIRQNITIALGLKAAFLVTTILGITGLWPAILADTGATVLVTANAMRLLTWKPAS